MVDQPYGADGCSRGYFERECRRRKTSSRCGVVIAQLGRCSTGTGAVKDFAMAVICLAKASRMPHRRILVWVQGSNGRLSAINVLGYPSSGLMINLINVNYSRCLGIIPYETQSFHQ